MAGQGLQAPTDMALPYSSYREKREEEVKETLNRIIE